MTETFQMIAEATADNGRARVPLAALGLTEGAVAKTLADRAGVLAGFVEVEGEERPVDMVATVDRGDLVLDVDIVGRGEMVIDGRWVRPNEAAIRSIGFRLATSEPTVAELAAEHHKRLVAIAAAESGGR
jgi:hypothetical protein